MPVYDMGSFRIQTKRRKHALTGCLLVPQGIIRIADLFMRCLIVNKITFKRCHFLFAEQRGILPTPHIPNDIHTFPFAFRMWFIKIALTYSTLHRIKVFLAAVFFPAEGNGL